MTPSLTTSGAAAAIASSLQKAANLSDVANADTSRANLLVPALRHAQCVATTNQALSGALPTIDGYAVQDGDRVLLSGQTTASQNGPWVAHTAGWVRPNDFPTGAVLTSRSMKVTGGTVYAGTDWVLVGTASITVDTGAQTWKATTVTSGQLPASVVNAASATTDQVPVASVTANAPPSSSIVENWTTPGALGANWTTPYTGYIATNPVAVATPGQAASAGQTAGALYTASQPVDAEIRSTVAALSGADFINLFLRATSIGSAANYRIKWVTTSVSIFNGASFLASNNGVTVAPGDGILARVIGSTIEVWQQPGGTGAWNLVVSFTDASLTSGYCGIAMSGAAAVGPVGVSAVSEVITAPFKTPASSSAFSIFVKDGDIYSIATKNGVVQGAGAADQTLNMKTFLQNAATAGKVAVIPEGDYNCGLLYVNGVPRILGEGARILCSQVNDGWNFSTGSQIAVPSGGVQQVAYNSTTALTVDALAGTSTINVASTAALLPGDIVFIGDTATMVGGNSGTNNVPALNAYKVYKVLSGTQFSITEPLIYDMTVANSAYVCLLGPGMSAAAGAQGGFIHGLFFQGTAAGGNNPTSTANGLRLWSLRNMEVDVSFQGLTNAAFQAVGCWNSDFKIKAEDLADIGVTGVTGQFGYGLAFGGPSAHCNAEVIGNRCRHTVTFTGTGHNCWASGESAGNTSTNFDAHAGFTSSGFDGIRAHGGQNLANMRGQGYRVLNAVGWQTNGVYIFDVPSKEVIENLTIIGPTAADTNGDTWAVRVDANCPGLTIQGGRWTNVAHGVLLTGTANIQDLNVMGVSAENLLGSAGTQAGAGSLVYIPSTSRVVRGHVVGNTLDDNQGSRTTSSVVYNASTNTSALQVQGNDLGSGIANTSGAQQSLVTILNAGFAPTLTQYTAAGANTYTVPAGATYLDVICLGGGGGGGSGRVSASGTAAFGGAGGSGGGMTMKRLRAADVTATVTATVGAAGTVGAAQATDSTNGNNGGGGGISSFGNYVQATGGNGGGGGTTSAPSAPTVGGGFVAGGSGAAGGTTNGNSANAAGAAGGGGAGGGITTTPTAGTGGPGAKSSSHNQGTAGTAGAIGASGSAAVAPTLWGLPGVGGGGGGSALTGAGGAGTTGAGPGGAGAGGGAALNGQSGSGAGGAGQPGAVYIIAT